MYNEKQKSRYLKQNDINEDEKEVFRRICATAQKVEQQEGTDLSNFTRDQVIGLLKTYDSKSRNYLRLICLHFTKYYSWCYNEGLVDMNNFTNWYDVKLSSAIIKEVLPAELLEDKFFSYEDMLKYVSLVKDPVNKLILYAPYCGILGEEHIDLRYLNIEDMNETLKEIKLYSGKIVKIDDLFIELIKNANASIRYDKEGLGSIDAHNEYGESKYVIKVCMAKEVNQILSSKIVNARYRIIKDQTKNNFLTAQLVYKNGLLNYIKNYYSNQNISLKDALFKKTQDVRKRGDSLYIYDNEVQELINEFGSNMPVRMLRHQMTDIIQFWQD